MFEKDISQFQKGKSKLIIHVQIVNLTIHSFICFDQIKRVEKHMKN